MCNIPYRILFSRTLLPEKKDNLLFILGIYLRFVFNTRFSFSASESMKRPIINPKNIPNIIPMETQEPTLKKEAPIAIPKDIPIPVPIVA